MNPVEQTIENALTKLLSPVTDKIIKKIEALSAKVDALSKKLDTYQEKNKNSFHYINKKINKMSKIDDQILAWAKDLDTATNVIADRITAILAKEPSISAEAKAAMDAETAKLKALGADPAQPIPAPTTPAPTPAPSTGTAPATPATPGQPV